jgi:uncharacterized protein YegP (UPF0339 family)
MGKPKFSIKKSGNGIMFNLIASNGQVIGTSQEYKSESALKNGIESVKRNSRSKVEDQTVEGFKTLTYPKYEIFIDNGGKHRFRLVAMNGEIILKSQGYASKATCKKGLDSINTNALGAEPVHEEPVSK